MKIHGFDKDAPPLRLLTPRPLNVVAAILKARRAEVVEGDHRMSFWQLVFLQSRANGCLHDFGDMPQVRWQWPRHTWFQQRKSQKLTGV